MKKITLILMALVLFSCGSGSNYNISFELVEPIDENNDPFATMKTMEVTVLNAEDAEESKKFTFDPTDSFADFSANLKSMDYWPEIILQIKGFDPEDKLVAIGQSTLILPKYYAESTVAIYLAPPLSISIPPQSVQMRHKRAGVKLVVPSNTNLLIFGGIEMDKDKTPGNTVSEVGLFSPQSYFLDALEDDGSNYQSGDGKGMVGHTATPLSSGSVLLAGGYSLIAGKKAYLETPVILSALTSELENEVELKDEFEPRTKHCANINYTEDYALVCGGEDKNGNKLKNCFKVTEDLFSMTKMFDLKTGRASFTQNVVVDSDNVYQGTLIYGGSDDPEKSAEWLGYEDNRSVLLENGIEETRVSHTAATLSDSRVIIVGGLVDGTASDSVIIFDWSCSENDDCETFSIKNSVLKTARYGHTLTAISPKKVLACGGYDGNGLTIADCELLQVKNDNSVENLKVINMNYSRAEHDAAYLPDGTVMIAGGYNEESGALDSVEIFMPEEF